MNRNYYKNLAEKYNIIQENNAMKGLEQLVTFIKSQTFALTIEYERGQISGIYFDVISDRSIYNAFFANEDVTNYYRNFTPAEILESFDSMISRINSGQVVTIHGDDTTFVYAKDLEKIKTLVKEDNLLDGNDLEVYLPDKYKSRP